MDVSFPMDNNTAGKQKESLIVYTARMASSLINGEAKLTVGEKSLTASALFGVVEIPYAEINALVFADYTVAVKSDGGDLSFDRMGEWSLPFYDALCEAYNKAMLRASYVKGEPILTARGDYRYDEDVATISGAAFFHVYEQCVVILPPDCSARRVPLCFVSALDKGEYALTLTLGEGERYTFARLGCDTAPFAEAVEKRIRALHEKTMAAVKGIAPSLSMAQAAAIAMLMPQGAAASTKQLAAIAPGFVQALGEKLSANHAAESYRIFKELCDPAQIHIGFTQHDDAWGGADDESHPPETIPSDPCLLWLIAPSPDGQSAAVEFAKADAATFVYRTGGDFGGFVKRLNRALESIAFRREVIRLSEQELCMPGNADDYMAVKRNTSLQFVRSSFIDRVIHASPASWKRRLLALWQPFAAPAHSCAPQTDTRFCARCSTTLNDGAKFCRECGAKQ